MSNYEHHVGKIKLVDENFTKEKLEKILSEDDIDKENTLEELEGRDRELSLSMKQEAPTPLGLG